MLNMKNKLAKRIMAFVLSGAMVISGIAPSGMTAYAAEASTETVEGYVEETEENGAEGVSGKSEEETPGEDSGADVKDEGAAGDADEETSKEETVKEAASTSAAAEEAAESTVERKTAEDDAEETTKEEVNKAESFSLDEKNLTAQTIAANAASVKIGDFTIKSGAKAVTIETGKTSPVIDGKTFTARIKFGGTSSIDNSSIHFTTSGAGNLTVYAQMGATDKKEDRYCGLFSYDENSTSGTEVSRGTVPYSNDIVKLPYTVPSAGNYYIGSVNSGMHIWAVYYEGEGGQTPNPSTPQESSTTQESSTPQESSTTEESSEVGPSIPDSEKHTVWMVGDSTMCSYLNKDGSHSEKHLYYPRYGYGTQLQNYLDGYYVVENLALSGRSSKSFLGEDNYKTLQNGIKEGDVLIIGWGHNDEKTGSDTYTAPNGTSTTENSFAKSLYDNYIKLATDKGAQPILCTPIVRRDDSGKYTGDKIHIANGGNYSQDIINLGEEVGVPVVDLTTLTKDLYVSAGVEGTKDFHSRSTENAGLDNTHLNIYGAKKVAYMLAKEIKEQHTDLDIAGHVRITEEPTKEKDLKPSPDYVEPTYTPPTTDSTIWEPYGIFKGSAFGSLGKAPTDSASTIEIGKTSDGAMRLKSAGHGKLSAGETGIAMYYYRLPSDAVFTLSAKAKVNAIDANVSNPGQAGFGLMARDNMYIDTNDKTLKGDYVAAGTLMDGSANCFYQRPQVAGKEFVKGTPAVTAPAVGDEYELSIRKNPDGDGYTCKFGDNQEQTGGFDFNLTAMDTQYQYIGMFVSRNADITFSDIKLIVNGKEIDIMDTTSAPGPVEPGPSGENDLSVDGESGEVTVTDGLLKGKNYGYKGAATFEVLRDMPFLTASSSGESYAITVDGKDYAGCVQGDGGNGPASNTTPSDNTAAFKITAIKDSRITFIVRQNQRDYYFTDAAKYDETFQNIPKEQQEAGGASHTFYMQGGHTYYFYAAGSKVMVAAIFIAKRTEGDEWPAQWTENPSESGSGNEGSSTPGSGEEGSSTPGSGAETSSEPGSGAETSSTPGSGTESSSTSSSTDDTSDTKIPANNKLKTISISGSNIKIEAANLIVNPKKAQYNVTVTYTYEETVDGKTYQRQQQLTEGLHYNVAFTGTSDGKSAGPQRITIEGTGKVTDLGKFINRKTVSYELVDKKTTDKKDISKEKAISLDKNAVKDLSYTGNYITPVVSGTDDLGAENYKVAYKNNVNAGKASVTVIGQGEYYGAKVLSFTIKPTDLSKTTEDDLKLEAENVKEFSKVGKAYKVTKTDEDKEKFAYKGSTIVLDTLTLTYAGKKLRPQEDYTIAYKINVQKGTGTATIKGINNFKGSININYEMEIDQNIATALGTLNTPENAVPAEYSSKGPRLTEIILDNGVVLKENVDYKVKYGKDCNKDVPIGNKELTVKITGAGAYKNAIGKDTEVAIEVVKGNYHIKDGTVVDAKKAGTEAKLINAAKITDASGAKVKNVTLATLPEGEPVTQITVIPDDADKDLYNQTTLSCHVATKLGSVKQVGPIEDGKFDGVNSVTVTKEQIADALGTGVKESDFSIVSYKGNNKPGSATVTIEATATGSYYGTKSLKFKIVSDKIDPDKAEGGAVDETSVIEDPSVEEESSGTEGSKPSGENPGTDESAGSGESAGSDETDSGETDGKRIDVWDFGAAQENDTNVYKNHITVKDWDACEVLTGGVFPETAQILSFGDLTFATDKTDRLFAPGAKETNSGGTPKVGTTDYGDGYTATGGWYCNGTRSDKKGYIEIANCSAGDRIDVYAGPHNKTETPFFYKGGNMEDEKALGTVSGDYGNKMSFIAETDGTYKIYANGGGKPFWCRVKRVPAVNVSGTITLGPLASLDSVTLKFVNETTKAETVATLNGTSFTAKLAAGYTYNAVISGAAGYGPTNDSKKVTLSDTDALTGKSGVTIVIETKELYTYSGTIKGFAGDYSNKSNLRVVMKTAEDVPNDDVTLTITELESENPKFTAQLEPDIEYTITLEGVNDYQVKGETTVNKNAAYTADIEVELRPTYAAAGNFVDLEGNAVAGVTALTFKNVDDNYEYPATVAEDGKSYTANLRDGAYSAVPTIDNYKTETHVIVDGAAVTKDILFVSTATEGSLERKADLYVGYSDKGDANYETVNKAVNAAKRMMPEKPSESDRITIHIAPGVYREQIIVTVPYISFVNDTPDKEVKITWYQGIGYLYYSCQNGFYNAQAARDKYEKGAPINWGAAVQLKATGFLAENIVFEHSFNRYITEEELADGVEPNPNADRPMPVRDYSLDVKSKNATERGAALYIDTNGDNAEFYRCKFLSSQDTIGTGKKGAHSYFKECFIEGGTDYICSEGDAVFDNCVLNFKGYSDDKDLKNGGYITAAKTAKDKDDITANEDIGYLFWNCTVTGSKELPVAPGYFGRPWDQNAKVAFVNTKLETASLITAKGWTDMSGATAANANFKEYNTTTLDGSTITTESPRTDKIVTENPIADTAAFKKYFGTGWTPKHYVEEASTVAFAENGNPSIVDNGDSSLPRPGHTLTVAYSLGANDDNDASIIKWYRVNDANESTLIKTSTAQQSRSYQIQTEDVGFFIKVEVTPTATSGKAGTAASAQMTNKVLEGWDEPGAADAVLGKGVNVFLAGDSTVKDYSAKGMHNNGNAGIEGSWGEYIQEFFNEEKVTIVNYANGGRSTRSFINEGSLDKIKKDMKAGDYLFIQFGHNDCADDADYVLDRYVPVGTPDASGKYPVTEGKKVTTPDSLKSKYGDTYYASTGEDAGSYKWFLKQYVDAAKGKDAIPVLVTPVARMEYNGDGTLKPKHQATGDADNAYVTAMKQLAAEENVLLIDGYELTKDLFVEAWKADGNNNDTYGKQIMNAGEKTHNNKLGGIIEAAVIANAIKELKDSEGNSLNITTAMKKPAQVLGKTTDGTEVFRIDGNGNLTANNLLANPAYSTEATYWKNIGQELIDKAAN